MSVILTQASMQEYAFHLIGENIDVCDEGFISPDKAKWKQYDVFPISHFLCLMESKEAWKNWFDEEVEMLESIRGKDYFDDLVNNPIRDHVVITFIDNKPHIWDGWHRVAAAIISGKKSIPVIMGVRDELDFPYEKNTNKGNSTYSF